MRAIGFRTVEGALDAVGVGVAGSSGFEAVEVGAYGFVGVAADGVGAVWVGAEDFFWRRRCLLLLFGSELLALRQWFMWAAADYSGFEAVRSELLALEQWFLSAMVLSRCLGLQLFGSEILASGHWFMLAATGSVGCGAVGVAAVGVGVMDSVGDKAVGLQLFGSLDGDRRHRQQTAVESPNHSLETSQRTKPSQDLHVRPRTQIDIVLTIRE